MTGEPERTCSYDVAFTAMCLWEEIDQPSQNYAQAESPPWLPHREQWGSNGLRDMVLSHLSEPCWNAFQRACEAYDRGYEEFRRQLRPYAGTQDFQRARDELIARGVTEPPDVGCLDYEFVPMWLRLHVDWSDATKPPRVRGGGS